MSKERYNIYVDTGRTDDEDRPFLRLVGSAWRGNSQNGNEYLSIELDALPPAGKLVGYPAKKNEA